MGTDRKPSPFGLWVRKQRNFLRLSRGELAEIAGVSETTVRNLETGRHGTTRHVRSLVEQALLDLNPALPRPDQSPLPLSVRLIGLRRKGTIVIGLELKAQVVRRIVNYLRRRRPPGATGREKSVVLVTVHLPSTTSKQGPDGG